MIQLGLEFTVAGYRKYETGELKKRVKKIDQMSKYSSQLVQECIDLI